MAAMKTMLTYVVDMGVSMKSPVEVKDSKSEPGFGPSKAEIAISIVQSHISARMMASKTFEAGVVLYGVDTTKNTLASTVGDYERVDEIIEMCRPTFSSLRELQERKCGSSDGDMLDGLIVAQESLMRYNKGKKYNRIMLLITDAETEVKGMDDLEAVLGEMKAQESILYVLVIGDPSTSASHSTVKAENCRMLKDLCTFLGGSFSQVMDLGSALSNLSSGPGLGTRPQRSKLTLEISPTCQLPCEIWTRVMKTTLPSLKREAKQSAGSLMEGGGAVKLDRTYRDTGEGEEEVPFDQRIKGYKYGPQYIPVSSADEEFFKIKGEPIIRVMGFIPYSRIPRHYFLESAIEVEGSTIESATAICALSKALRSKSHVALVRFVKRKDSEPVLGCLMPPVHSFSNLLLHRLPCREDYRDYFLFPNLPGPSKLSAQQRAAVSSFVDAMTIADPNHPVLTFNPSLQGILLEVQKRAIGPSSSSCSGSLASTLGNPFTSLGDSPANHPTMDALVECFPLTAVDVTSSAKKRKTYWSDLDLETGEEGKDAAERKKASASNDSSAEAKEDIIELTKLEMPKLDLGSLNPIEDFQSIVAASSGDTSAVFAAAETMMTIVEQLIVQGGSNAHFRKAVGCIKALRAVTVQQGLHERFNSFLSDRVKCAFSKGRHSRFWTEFLTPEGSQCSLVTNVECHGSSVSPEEASEFFVEKVSVVQEIVEVQPVADEDDLFSSME